MIRIMDAARYLIWLSYHGVDRITPLKLQKLLYLSQGWSYVWDDVPLFADQFEAWQYGPVNMEVYQSFKKYGRQSIPAHEGICTVGDGEAGGTLEAVWDYYGSCSSFDLVELTHSQSPWKGAYKAGRPIRNEEIRQYFRSIY